MVFYKGAPQHLQKSHTGFLCWPVVPYSIKMVKELNLAQASLRTFSLSCSWQHLVFLVATCLQALKLLSNICSKATLLWAWPWKYLPFLFLREHTICSCLPTAPSVCLICCFIIWKRIPFGLFHLYFVITTELCLKGPNSSVMVKLHWLQVVVQGKSDLPLGPLQIKNV